MNQISAWIRCFVVALACATPFACPPRGMAEDLVSGRISVGVAGAFKVGRWTPLTVTLSKGAPDDVRLEVAAPDPEGSVVTFQGGPALSRADSPTRMTQLFQMGRLEGTLRVRVLSGDRVLAARQLRVSEEPDADVAAPLRQSVFLLAHLRTPIEAAAPPESRIASLLRASSPTVPAEGGAHLNPLKITAVDLDSADGLPVNAAALSSLDAIFLDGRADIDAEHGRALEHWVRAGGHLVIATGRDATAFGKSALAAWLPVKLEGPLRLRDLSAIESFSRQSARIMSATDEPVDGARLVVADGSILAASLDGPLVCRAPLGMGRVTLLGIDLDAPPLRRWPGRAHLLRRLLDIEQSQSKRTTPVASRLTQTGITELGTQLDASQDDFASIARVTTWPVMGLLIALLVVIGPLDYLLVHKLLKRPQWTWITFPLAALAMAGAAVAWGSKSKGHEVLVNQLDLVDVDGVAGFVQAHSYALVYSPENRRLNVAGKPTPLRPSTPTSSSTATKGVTGEPRIGWHGRPESSFGGMYRSASAGFNRPAYTVAPGAERVNELPIAIWSTRALEAEWSGSEPRLVDSDLESRNPGQLNGTFRHHLPVAIDDWIIAFGHQVYRPAINPATGAPLPLLPEVPWSSRTASQRELAGFLTGAKQSVVVSGPNKYNEELRIEFADYDPLNRNPVDIMRMLTFHEAAGGTPYTGLGNGAMRRFDWSGLLSFNRAILVGRIRTPAFQWTIDGTPVKQSQSVTFVRLLIPVRARGAKEELSKNDR